MTEDELRDIAERLHAGGPAYPNNWPGPYTDGWHEALDAVVGAVAELVAQRRGPVVERQCAAGHAYMGSHRIGGSQVRYCPEHRPVRRTVKAAS